MHLLFFVRVVEVDDVVITGQPKKPTVEVTKVLPDELLIPQSVREGILLFKRKIHHGDPLGGSAMLIHGR
jgi:hypothetical protein